jgi:hypothetical protein
VGAGILGACLRLLYISQIRSAPFFDLRFGDAESYHLWAQRIAAGEWLGRDVFYQAPLYPYFLAALYRLFGDAALTVRASCKRLMGDSCALSAAAGVRLFGRRGVLAGLLLAIYPPAIFLDGLLEQAALVTFLFAALLALTRENALALLLPLLAWIAFGPRPQWRPASVLLAGCAAVLLPVAARNLAVGGEFLVTTAQFGPISTSVITQLLMARIGRS